MSFKGKTAIVTGAAVGFIEGGSNRGPKHPRRCLVADEAGVLSVLRSTIDAGVHAKERVGHRKRNSGTAKP